MHIWVTKYEIFLGKGVACNHQNRIYVYILTEKGLKFSIYGSPKHILSWKGGLPTCDYQKSYISVNSDYKGPEIMPLATLNMLNIVYTYRFWQKRDWNCAFMVPQNKHSLMKRRAASFGIATTKNHIFLEIQTKKGLMKCIFNLLSSQNTKIFLGGTAPLQPPKSHIRIDFDRKGTEIVHSWTQEIHIFHAVWKVGQPHCDHQKPYISWNSD